MACIFWVPVPCRGTETGSSGRPDHLKKDRRTEGVHHEDRLLFLRQDRHQREDLHFGRHHLSRQVDAAWWRREGHLLQAEDLADALRAKPGVLIIGTGYYGVMRVPRETVERIAALGIDVNVEKTGRAVELHNDLELAGNVIAALHLTC